MASPLRKRFPREMRNNLGKYLGIFLLMSVTIALTSGFLTAAHSISVIIDDIPATYHVEDGRFTTAFEATDAQLDAARDAAEDAGGIDVFANWSINADCTAESNDGRDCTLRTYAHRTDVDLAAYAEGRVPEAADEVAVDRVFAQNNGVRVGDAITLNGRSFTVCGIMTTPDNQALFQNNSDFTVNTLTFGVAEAPDAGFAALRAGGQQPAFTYSFTFRNPDLTLAERTDAEKDGPKWAERSDDRCTRFGALLRKTRLDELPQLWNILKGEMSFVGPRPERKYFYEQFEKYIVGFSNRLVVTPGLTGYAQVNGGYELAPEEKIVYDMEYIARRSIRLDLQCIVKTALLIFTHDGAR